MVVAEELKEQAAVEVGVDPAQAAQAVLVAAGGKVQTLDGEPLKYGKQDVLNPYFIAAGGWYSPDA